MKKLASARNLQDLADRLNALDEDEIQGVDLSSLPVFSRRQVRNTSEVWSWDKTQILVFSNEWGIKPRCIICGEATFHCDHDQTPLEINQPQKGAKMFF